MSAGRNESFRHLQTVRQIAEHQGYFYYPVEKETTEALITDPLLSNIRSKIKRRGFSNMIRRLAITFSGYADDPREIQEIPEVRNYWRELDQSLPEFPALLTNWPLLRYNGPKMHLLLLGDIISLTRLNETDFGMVLTDAEDIINNAQRRIRAAGLKYHLPAQPIDLVAKYFREDALA